MSSRATDHRPDDLELAYHAAHAHRRGEDRLPSTPTRTAVLKAARQAALDVAAAATAAQAAEAAPREAGVDEAPDANAAPEAAAGPAGVAGVSRWVRRVQAA